MQTAEKDAKFDFDESCMSAFEEIKSRLVIAPIMATPYWNKDFEIMCDASDYAMGSVLGQRIHKTPEPYTMLEKILMRHKRTTQLQKKQMMAMVFSCEKFKPYILGSHVIVKPEKILFSEKW